MINVYPGRVTTDKEATREYYIIDNFYRQNYSMVFFLARRMLSSEADAEDVTQEVFLQVAKNIHTFRGDAKITTWLYRVTVNTALLCRRQARRRDRTLGRAVDKVFNDSPAHDPWADANEPRAMHPQ